jgi:hypothetical protein
MKAKFLLFAIPCLFLASCGGSADKEAAKKVNDSIAAVHHFDSLQNAIKMMRQQDSVEAAKGSDTTKKMDSAKGQK